MATDLHSDHKKQFQLERLILFSDAVFAIAITLLALEIKVPELPHGGISEKALLWALVHLVPKFVGFLVSFFLIGIYWTLHHRMFGFVVAYTTKLAWLNLGFLLSVVLMPFSTGLFGEYATPESLGLKTPLIVYNANICFTGIMNYWLWSYLGRPENGVAAGFPDRTFVQFAKIRTLVVPLVFCLSIPISFFDPHIARCVPLLIPGVMRLLRVFFERTKPSPAQAAA
jgi:uncharacterized membrane protein